jgi:hypothetical protein
MAEDPVLQSSLPDRCCTDAGRRTSGDGLREEDVRAPPVGCEALCMWQVIWILCIRVVVDPDGLSMLGLR